jgi:hypothetical protein
MSALSILTISTPGSTMDGGDTGLIFSAGRVMQRVGLGQLSFRKGVNKESTGSSSANL